MASTRNTGQGARLARTSGGRLITSFALAGLLVGSSALLAVGASTDAGAVPGLATIDDADVDAIVADIDEAVELATASLEQLQSERLHREAVLQQTGDDPAAIRDWVAANTRWIPYQGTLRGADGVLMDRTGNSLDRSSLLAALLTDAGYATRLARTELPPDVAASVVGASEAAGAIGDITSALAGAAEVATHREAIQRSSDAILELIDAQAGASPATSAIDSAADHWWVQADIDGTWIDLDAAAMAGSLDEGPTSSFEDSADLPEELHHRVTIRVVVERSQDGETTTFVPLEYTHILGVGDPLPSFELAFDSTIAEPPDKELDLDGMASAITHWRPSISGASGDLVGDWFTTDGRLEIPSATPVRDVLGDATSALGRLGSDESPADAPSKLTAVWLEYETDGPGVEPRVERRDLLRNTEPTPTDVAAALLGSTNVLVQTATVDPDAFFRMLLENTVVSRNALIALTFMAAGREDERILPALQQAELKPTNLYALAMARSRWGKDPGASYIGRANIWAEHQTYDRIDDGLVERYAVDIVHNDIDVAPSALADAARIRVEQGVLDTLAEYALTDGADDDNTWARFEVSLEGGSDWQAFSDPAELADAAAGLSEADIQRMTASIMAGDVVIVDPAPTDGIASWWRVDPSDGRTLGMGPNGWGQVSERVATWQVPAGILRAFQRSQATRVAQGGRNLARQAARYFRNNPLPEPGTMTIFELVEGVIVRIYIL